MLFSNEGFTFAKVNFVPIFSEITSFSHRYLSDASKARFQTGKK